MKKTFLFAACAVALLASCNKDTPNPASYIVGKWQFEKLLLKDFQNGAITNIDTLGLSSLPTCEQDDSIVYLSNGKGYWSNGANLCPGSAQTSIDSFQYVLSNNRTKLYMLSRFNDTEKTERTSFVRSLTASELVLVDTLLGFGNGNYSVGERHFRKIP